MAPRKARTIVLDEPGTEYERDLTENEMLYALLEQHRTTNRRLRELLVAVHGIGNTVDDLVSASRRG